MFRSVTPDPVCYQSDYLEQGVRAFRAGSYWVISLPDGSTVTVNIYSWGGVMLVRAPLQGRTPYTLHTNHAVHTMSRSSILRL